MKNALEIISDVCLSCGKNVRSKRIWTLLEYLVTYRFGCVAQDELIDLLYREDNCGTPSGALKTLIHRAREALSRLGFVDGKEVILRCTGGYRWNPDIPLEIDTERFESLVREAGALEKGKDKQLMPEKTSTASEKTSTAPEKTNTTDENQNSGIDTTSA